MKDNSGLVNYCKQALAEKWGYVWGTFGKTLTESLLESKIRQYPDGVGGYETFIRSHWLNRKTTDCVGLIKSFLWFNGTSVNYDNTTDVSADSMYSRAKEKGLISTIPNTPGICLWKKGHTGVYIGNGQVIEAHGTKFGVIQTPLRGAGATAWTKWYKCPYIEYTKSTVTPIITQEEYKGMFSEKFYLKAYPDVTKAVLTGAAKSGYQHYIEFGKKEGRKPCPPLPLTFNEGVYLEKNTDVKKAVETGSFTCGAEHYLQFGFAEGRVYSENLISTANYSNLENKLAQIKNIVG